MPTDTETIYFNSVAALHWNLSGGSRAFRHVKISPAGTQAEEIIFTGPIAGVVEDLSQTAESSESSRSVKHIKVGSRETAYTFQMDVSNLGGISAVKSGEQQVAMMVSNKQDPSTGQPQVTVESDQLAENENTRSGYVLSSFSQDQGEKVVEQSFFDKTVQLQRTVNQSSDTSEGKKVAFVYLDHEEEDDEDNDNDGQWF